MIGFAAADFSDLGYERRRRSLYSGEQHYIVSPLMIYITQLKETQTSTGHLNRT